MTTLSDRNTPFNPATMNFLPSMADIEFDVAKLLPNITFEPNTMVGPTANLSTLMLKEAVKQDNGKPDWSLVPFEALEGMVRVLEFGANKYARNNWKTNGGFSYRRVLTACIRHLFAYMRGEDNDPESGLSHISHAQCNLLFIGYYLTNKEKFNKDDRGV